MTSFQNYVVYLIRLTILDPRAAAREVLNFSLPSAIVWNIVLLVVILSVLLTYGTAIFVGQENVVLQIAGTPMIFALFMVAEIILLILAVFWVGKMMGGAGQLEGIALLIAWLQAVWLIAQVFQMFIMLGSPALASLIGLVVVLFGLWVLAHFVAEAHGFESVMKGAGVLGLAIFGMIAGLSFLLSIIGIGTLGLATNV